MSAPSVGFCGMAVDLSGDFVRWEGVLLWFSLWHRLFGLGLDLASAGEGLGHSLVLALSSWSRVLLPF